MKNSKKIHCYINRKYLNCPPDKNSSSGNIIGASIVIENEDKGFEYKLYDIERYSILHLHTTDSWYITRYILKNEKAIRADKVKCEYDKKKMLMGEVNSISELIDDLINSREFFLGVCIISKQRKYFLLKTNQDLSRVGTL